MVRQALAIGDVESVKCWQDIYQRWRLDNSVMPGGGGPPTPGGALAPAGGRRPNPYVTRFREAYHAYERSGVGGLMQRIQSKVTLAELADAYDGAYDTIRPEVGTTDDGSERARTRGVRDVTRRKRVLFFAINPDARYLCGDDPTSHPVTKKRFDKLDRMHSSGTRWRQVRESLGLGVLGLFPPTVHSSFVERDLRADEVPLWISLVKEFNPACIDLGAAILKGLQLALQGSRPVAGMLRLERATESDIKARLESRQLCSLFDEDTDGGGWLSSGPTPSPVTPNRPTFDGTAFGGLGDDWTIDQFLSMDQFPLT